MKNARRHDLRSPILIRGTQTQRPVCRCSVSLIITGGARRPFRRNPPSVKRQISSRNERGFGRHGRILASSQRTYSLI
jgi:hypothetical protein